MILKRLHKVILLVILVALGSCMRQSTDLDHVAALAADVQVVSNVEYARFDSASQLLDVYVSAKKIGEPPWVEYSENRKPTLLFLHGGGWTSGDKISRSLQVLPYVDKGWCVVTANYRHLDQADLPAIVGDARLALNWIYENAEKYKFDTTKIVVSGESAGGHLALMTGLITQDSLFQKTILINRNLKVAAIINWFGVADLVKASASWDTEYFMTVVKDSSKATELLTLASPVNYLRKDSPPVMTIHGDLDTAAPYEQGVILHNRLNEVGIKNYFLPIPGKKHGNFSGEERTAIFKDVWKFLKDIGIE